MMTPEYIKGLCFIIAVAFIWAASSVLVQYAYTDGNFHSPFLVTYIGVSLFTLWLLPMPTTRNCLALFSRSSRISQVTNYHTLSINEEHETLSPQAGALTSTSMSSEENDNDGDDHQSESASYRFQPWSVEDHKAAARKIAPVWFLANWSYNASLAYTSITSSTVLASTGSIFTFLFALFMQEERFSMFKFGGVLLGVTGSIITALQDGNPTDVRRLSQREIWGDALGLMSAVGYGAYAVQTCVLCPKDESLYSMKMLLGYIGLYNLVCLSPIVVYICIDDSAQLQFLILMSLVVKGLFDNVLSDYLWLRAVILTSPTTTTVGVGLTIPLAFLSDIFIEAKNVSRQQGLGALSVLAGFVLVNIGANTSMPSHTQSVNDSELMTVSTHSVDQPYADDSLNETEIEQASADGRENGEG